MKLNELTEMIKATDIEAAKRAEIRWNSIAKPLGSLGLFEENIIKIAAIQGTENVSLSKRSLFVFCADNGVVAEGVTQCGSDVTAAVATALAERRSTVSPMARFAECMVIPVDMGIKDFEAVEGVVSRRVKNGTENICNMPAMMREECICAILAGAELVMQSDADIIAMGEMGIGNTTTAATVNTVLLNESAEALTGRGAGLSDAGLMRKIAAVKKAIEVNSPNSEDAVDVLCKVGGLDIAAMCGAFLGAAAAGKAAIIDGVISCTAALCAFRICPACVEYMLASHVSSEPAAKLILSELGLSAPISAGMHLGEGGGAVMLFPLLDSALAVYNSAQSFERLGIEAYTPQI